MPGFGAAAQGAIGRLDGQAHARAQNVYLALRRMTKRGARRVAVAARDVDGETLFRIDDGVHIILQSQKSRLGLYFEGVERRLRALAAQYRIDQIDFKDGDAVIDCGANIGEIGRYLTLLDKEIAYHAFEPARLEFLACRENNKRPTSFVEPFALWNQTETLRFYEKNASGDSSVLEMNQATGVTEVEARPLDTFLDRLPARIKLLKLEAEGAEPEVIDGAAETLRRVEFIALDAGFERGREQTSTLPACVNRLIPAGFEALEITPGRLTLLLRNARLDPA